MVQTTNNIFLKCIDNTRLSALNGFQFVTDQVQVQDAGMTYLQVELSCDTLTSQRNNSSNVAKTSWMRISLSS